VTELSIIAAAAEASDRPAIVTTTRTLTFADCARLAAAVPATTDLVATPAIETILAIYRALEAARPLALLHPRLAADELDRQRHAVSGATIANDQAFVLFTSGSTGRARGVVLSRAAIVAAAHASAARLGWRADDRWVLCLPLAHAGGLSIVVRCLVARMPLVLLDGDFEPARVHALLRDQRATLASLVPTQLAALVEHTPTPGHLRAVLLGGAAAAPALVESARSAGWPVFPTYGLTETFGQVATATSPGGVPELLPGVTLTSHETLHVRGPMLATAYLDGTPIAPELVTADLGTVEANRVHIRGRRDDVIVTGGENVHPLEIEAVLAATPGVRAACVFGIPDPRWGQVVGAALATDATFSNTAALATWHAALPAHARPRRLALVPTLPQLASGKLDRQTIAALPTVPLVYEGTVSL
jgi:O-succinylbenzoic acid--CoA ligase